MIFLRIPVGRPISCWISARAPGKVLGCRFARSCMIWSGSSSRFCLRSREPNSEAAFTGVSGLLRNISASTKERIAKRTLSIAPLPIESTFINGFLLDWFIRWFLRLASISASWWARIWIRPWILGSFPVRAARSAIQSMKRWKRFNTYS